MNLPNILLDPLILTAFQEDFGSSGDITVQATIPQNLQMKAVIRARTFGVIAGIQVAVRSFVLIDPSLIVKVLLADGALVNKDDVILTIEGNAHSILMAERVALNFMGHLGGIATATQAMVKALAGTKAKTGKETKITDTRKTTPGFRALEKQAVRLGGGVNHRFGLYDAILIKDNHIAIVGSIKKTLEQARAYVGHMVKIEIEVDNLAQLKEVCEMGLADCVLLDNMPPDILMQAVMMVKGTMLTEASGTVTLANIAKIAMTGVDYISSGWLTHSAPNLDLGLDVV